MHGTADTTIHPQNSMMLVRGVMRQQQQQFIHTGIVSSNGRRKNNSTASSERVAGGFPTRVGAIRLSQLVIPDADLSNSRMATDIENGSPLDNHHQLLHSIFSHVTQYLASECFTSINDGNRGQGIRTRGRRLRKQRRRRWRTSNRDQEKSEDQQQQQREEGYQHHQKNQDNEKSNSDTSIGNGGGGDRSSSGRYRRHDIDRNQPNSERSIMKDMAQVKEKNNVVYSDNIRKNISWINSYMGNFTIPNNSNNESNNGSKRKERNNDDDEAEEFGEEDDEDEDSDDEYYGGEDNDEEDRDSEDGVDDNDE